MTGNNSDKSKHDGGFAGVLIGLILAAVVIPLIYGLHTYTIIFSIMSIITVVIVYNSKTAYEAFPQVQAALFPGLEQIEDKERIKNDELRQQVEDRKAEGWEVEEINNSAEKVILKTTKGGTIGGHALTGITTGLWTFGAGNVAYSKLSKKKNAERMVLRAGENISEDSNELKQIPNIPEKLGKLKDLNEEGVITDKEFANKKEDLLEKY